ncbi:hypothetical protein CEK29_05525 [Bordetella genomosp. 5]|uniref:hypothetical protein n=1 Tax=Bordetella genomosp. 5 TaxID=1395608 RepID=UPI000B9EA8D3|nr:hypothetical protein [Bordetella genomosp. 5]OZI46331.1 hypothetical protein CEK29_05525 [Bordetella genomosp. 5]
MAKHQVKSYKVEIAPSGEWVGVVIETELQKPYRFQLTPDQLYPTVLDIEEKLNAALDHCISTHEKVDVSVFKERFYVSINVKGFIDTRFSGQAV